MLKKVSIIIPTYKGNKYIEAAVSSALNQDYGNVEVIVVDDNGIGTEEQVETKKTLEKFVDDNRFKYIFHKENKNGAAARNTGFQASEGDYITLLDDDDIYMPFKVRLQAEVLEKLDESWGMTYCSRIIDYGKKEIRKARKSGCLLYNLLLHRVVIGSNSMFLRRNIYESLGGFDETFKRHQDYEFSVRVSAICKISAVSEVCYIHHNEIGRNSPESIEIAWEYRIHYINKMMPYIKRFSKFKQYFIIYSNMLDVIPSSDRKKRIISTCRQVLDKASVWLPKKRIDIYIFVFFEKAISAIAKRMEVQKAGNTV